MTMNAMADRQRRRRRQRPLLLILVCTAIILYCPTPVYPFQLLADVRHGRSNRCWPHPPAAAPSQPLRPTVRHRYQCSALSTLAATTKTTIDVGLGHAVILHKVVRAPPGRERNHGASVLARLVAVLQDPGLLRSAQLPMIYEVETDDDRDDDDNDVVVVSWNSPLSPHAEATRLQVQVVAIRTSGDDNDDDDPTPHMALVVIQKQKVDNAALLLPPMLADLFAASEKQIVAAVERALDTFSGSDGRGQQSWPQSAWATASPRKSHNTAEQQQTALLDKVQDDDDNNNDVSVHARATARHNMTILDAELLAPLATTTTTAVRTTLPGPNNTTRAIGGTNSNNTTTTNANTTTTNSGIGLDFAVQAAQQAARARRQRPQQPPPLPPQGEDFAVAAARERASTSRTNAISMDATAARARVSSDELPPPRQPRTPTPDNAAAPDVDPATRTANWRPPMLGNDGQRAFHSTISTPQSFGKQRQRQPPKTRLNQAVATPGNTARDATRRNVHINRVNASVPISDALGPDGKQLNATMAVAVATGDDPLTQEMVQSTQDALDEMIASGDMSPEDLLRSVMQFGQEQQQTEQGSSGQAALDQAKRLLRQQRQRREDRQRSRGAAPAANELWQQQQLDEHSPNVKEAVGIDEELRRMFEAGESLANGQIEKKGPRYDDDAAMAEADALIAGDKSVAAHGRVLDDEMAELEVRLNQMPGQEIGQHSLFDVMSGPEQYNRNVDPEAAVNWPGALPGSQQRRLPRELDEAVKQATFAAGVLSRLEASSNDNDSGKKTSYTVGNRQLDARQVENLRAVVAEAVQVGLIADPLVLEEERSRLDVLVAELVHQPSERAREIASNYKDLLLSDNFVLLVKERRSNMADRDIELLRTGHETADTAPERQALMHLVTLAQVLLKEVQAFGAELEAQQLEVIRSICKVAMDPTHQTEEDVAMALSDAVRDMRPLLDDAFVAYLQYAVTEEEGRLARGGLVDDPDENQWLFVLKIVQQGVYAELAKGINRYIEHIWYVLRMETSQERRMLLADLIDAMPTMDVRPFVRVVSNIVGALGRSANMEFGGGAQLGEMTNKLLQLHRDVNELLPPDRIDEMSRDADDWARQQKQRLLEQRKLTRQRLQASRETEYLDNEVASRFRGEVERIE